MSKDFSVRLQSVDRALLTPIVRDAVEDDAAELADWSMSPLTGGASQDAGYSYGLYRFQGNAKTENRIVPWSLILKATAGSLAGSDEPARWDYWKREVLAYQSGFLVDLPGDIEAPRCFGVVEYPDNEFWIWLEEIPAGIESDWSLKHYGQVARHLGQFNGGYLAGHPMPHREWFSSGRVKEWLEWSEPVLLKLPELCQNPLAKRWFTAGNIERTLRLRNDQAMLLELLERLPHTFCHHDAHRRNLTLRPGPSGKNKTVAIDWQIAGKGAIGEEIATLFGVSLQFASFPTQRAYELDRTVYESYLGGLRDAGWQGDERLVRFGFTASVALFIAVGAVGHYLTTILGDEGELTVRRMMGCTREDLLDQYALLQKYLLDLGDEASELANILA
jgi:hypothetical protein